MTDATTTKDDAATTDAPEAPESSKPEAKKTAAKKKTAAAKKPTLTVAKEGDILRVPIASIAYDNPRKEPAALYEEGFVLIGNPKNVSFEMDEESQDWILERDGSEPQVAEDPFDESNFVSLSHMAINEDIEQARRYVTLIETYETVNRKESPNAPQSIVELAADIRLYGQMYPILVRKNGKTGFTGIDGGRRMAAILYLHAKSRVLKADKETDPIFGDKTPAVRLAEVLITEQNCKADEVKLRSLVANLSRNEFTALQEGRVYHDMLQEINPETDKKFTSKDAAAYLNVNPGTFRNREALWREPTFNDDGKQVKGLTDNQRQKVADGEMLVTAASRKALGEQHYSETGKPSTKRNKGVPLSAMQKLYDETAESNKERRQGIADCMGITNEQAAKESEARIEAVEAAELAAA